MLARLTARRRGLLRPTSSLWTCFPAPLRSSLWIGPMSPVSLSRRSSTSGFLAARTLGLNGGSYRFSVICITRSPDPGNRLFHAFKQFMPRRMRDHSTPSSSLSREHSLPRKESTCRSWAQAHSPPTTVWGACGWPFPHRQPRRRVDLKRPDRPAA